MKFLIHMYFICFLKVMWYRQLKFIGNCVVFRHGLFHILFVILPFGLFAQNKVTVSKSDFLIGEPATIYYELNNFKSDAKIQFIPWRKVIPCLNLDKDSPKKELEILFFRDTTINENQTQWIGAYTIMAWDTGEFIVPPYAVLIDDEEVIFESVKLHVFLPTLTDGDEIIESELPFQDYETDRFYYVKKYLPWIIGGIVILIFIIWLLVKRKKKNEINPFHSKSLLEKTLQEIEVLASKKLIEQNKTKDHYIESSFIFRHYLAEQFKVNMLEKTSDETRIVLIAKGLPKNMIQEIQILFNHFDSVKFAKFNPETSESEAILNQIKAAVLKINKWSQKDV